MASSYSAANMPPTKPLTIANNQRFFGNHFGYAPRGMMLRELLMNAIEALPLPEELGTRLVRVIEDACKLVIINSGKGMTMQELEDACQLAYSGVYKDFMENRGEGGKISCLKFNPEGMRYRSRTNGVISQVTIYRDKTTGEWVTASCLPAPHIAGTIPIGGMNDVITAVEAIRYAAFGDFTEVKLLGLDPNHMTAITPYEFNPAAANTGEVPQEIYARFYTLGAITNTHANPAGMNLKFVFDPIFIRQGQQRPFVAVGDLPNKNLPGLQSCFDQLANRFVVDAATGIKIEYLKHNDTMSKSPHANYSMGADQGFGGIVFRNEIYNATVKGWGAMSQRLGIFGLGTQVSIFLHVDNANVVKQADAFRQMLLDHNDVQINLEDFEQLIIANRPQWLMAMINNALPPRKTNNIAQTKLAKLAQKIWSTVAQSAHPGLFTSGGAKKPGKPNPNNPRPPRNKTKVPKPGPSVGNGTGGLGNGALKPAARGATGARKFGRVPNPIWVDKLSCGKANLAANRGALFDPMSYNLVMNEDYSSFHETVANVFNLMLKQKAKIAPHRSTIEIEISKALKEKVAFMLGSAILRVEAKGIIHAKDWSASDVHNSLTVEALSMVFDMCAGETDILVRDMMMTQLVKAI